VRKCVNGVKCDADDIYANSEKQSRGPHRPPVGGGGGSAYRGIPHGQINLVTPCHVRRVPVAFVTSSTTCLRRRDATSNGCCCCCCWWRAPGRAGGVDRPTGRGHVISWRDFRDDGAMGATGRDVADVTGNIFISRRRDRRVVRQTSSPRRATTTVERRRPPVDHPQTADNHRRRRREAIRQTHNQHHATFSAFTFRSELSTLSVVYCDTA